MVEKKSQKSIGDCGITWQQVNGHPVLEIGYHLETDRGHQGFAAEAARACKKLAFETLHADEITSIIRDTNLASQKIALAKGMKLGQTFIKHYQDIDLPHIVFSITRQQYENEKKAENEKENTTEQTDWLPFRLQNSFFFDRLLNSLNIQAG